MWRTLLGLAVVALGVLAWPPSRLWCEGRVENGIGVVYSKGLGVGQDPVAARRWFERAAEHGAPAGAYNLAFAYQNGAGIAADPHQAARWYERAARAGMAQAGNNLALLYADGGLGTPDLVRGRAWLKRSLPDAAGELREAIAQNLTAMEHEMGPADIASSDALLAAGLKR